ncbi:hypothetical protein K5549_018400, partial [Capra hircus]
MPSRRLCLSWGQHDSSRFTQCKHRLAGFWQGQGVSLCLETRRCGRIRAGRTADQLKSGGEELCSWISQVPPNAGGQLPEAKGDKSGPGQGPRYHADRLNFGPCTHATAERLGRTSGLYCSTSPTPTSPPLCCCPLSRPITSAAGPATCAAVSGLLRGNTTASTPPARPWSSRRPFGSSHRPTPRPCARRSPR